MTYVLQINKHMLFDLVVPETNTNNKAFIQ